MSLLLVDGYNIINSLPQYKSLAKEELEEARIKLIEDLAILHYLGDKKIEVVFDAARAGASLSVKQEVAGIVVIFTAQGKTADSYIEKRAFKEVQREQVFVATADYYEQMLVFSKGVFRMTPNELAREIAQAREEAYSSLPQRSRLVLEERIDSKVRKALQKLLSKEDK